MHVGERKHVNSELEEQINVETICLINIYIVTPMLCFYISKVLFMILPLTHTPTYSLKLPHLLPLLSLLSYSLPSYSLPSYPITTISPLAPPSLIQIFPAILTTHLSYLLPLLSQRTRPPLTLFPLAHSPITNMTLSILIITFFSLINCLLIFLHSLPSLS